MSDSMSAPKLGIVMDAIESIKPYKDSSFAMLLEAQRRGWDIHYMQLQDLFLDQGIAWTDCERLEVRDNTADYFRVTPTATVRLTDFDVILMRKDPPFNMEYIYATYLLQQAEEQGTLIVNKPASLRDCNEKLYTREFPQCCTDTRVTRKLARFHEFLNQHRDIIIKPLDGMGGRSIFRIRHGDSNSNAIFEAVSAYGQNQIMLQRFIPEILEGDKRIIVIDGTPVPYALARVPSAGDNRGNLAAGGKGVGVALSDKDRQIVETQELNFGF